MENSESSTIRTAEPSPPPPAPRISLRPAAGLQNNSDPIKQQEENPDGDSEFVIRVIAPEGTTISPSAMALPVVSIGGALLVLGTVAGIPMGMAYGRSAMAEEEKKRTGLAALSKESKQVIAVTERHGAVVAAKALAYATLLCGMFGVGLTYAIHRYYDVNSLEEFGQKMRAAIPEKRKSMEARLEPTLDAVSYAASETLPGMFYSARDWFAQSGLGQFIHRRFEIAAENRLSRTSMNDSKESDES